MAKTTMRPSTLEWATASRRRSYFQRLITLVLLLAGGALFAGDTVYEKPSVFLARTFGKVPRTQALSLNGAQQARVKRLLGRNYQPAKVRYWSDGRKTAWILEEIGKTQPITAGYVVSGGKITEVKVLIYRESHGQEVARASFTKQFRGAGLGKTGMDRQIRNIAGATLSVRALTKLGAVALYFDSIKP
jgi:hypothetical protein